MTLSHRNIDKRLSIRVAPSGFSFCVSPIRERIILYEQCYRAPHPDQIAEELQLRLYEFRIDVNPFAEVRVIIDTPYATLMPITLFAPSAIEEILEYNFCYQQLHTHMALPVGESGIVQLFSIRQELFQLIKQQLPKAIITCTSETILRWLLFISTPQQPTLAVYHSGDHLYIYGFSEGKLIASNIFQTTHPSEIGYHIHALWQSLELSYSDHTLLLLGNSDHIESIKEELQESITHIAEQTSPDSAWQLQHFHPDFDSLLLLQL